MKKAIKLGVVGAVGLTLSGCGVFGGGHTVRADVQQQMELATQEAVAEINLDVGRENLRNGNLAAAARYLTEAREHPLTRAEATNALGVVYARLQRLDVARRYFAEALEADPQNALYSTNLARLERDVSFAMQRRADNAAREPVVAAVEVEPEPVPAPRPQSPVWVEQQASARLEIATPGVIQVRTSEGTRQRPEIQVFAAGGIVQEIARADVDDDEQEQPSAVTGPRVIEYPIRREL
ncbi:tetratricopeptide repeat protein [Aurantiacibacter gilvus]|uniref:Tetratricopeptide repeat protein n=1 Tax=Aurantiacibacter gilvus TaxID=3139141 RepID=A0ABU9IF15_9SPHN